MTIRKFPIPPGVDRQGTKHSIGARWYESNNMRFRDDYPETIGGWIEDDNHVLKGFGRGMHSWTDFDDNQYICVGTNFKFYLLVGANSYDITPVRLQRIGGSSLTSPFQTTFNSSIVEVTDAGHGANLNDFVVFKTVAVSVGGLATTDFTEEPGGFQILEVVDEDTYKVDVGVLAGFAAVGGGTVTIDYKVSSGSISDSSGSGYGVGLYGGDTFVPTDFNFATPNPVTSFNASAVVTLDVTGFGGTAFNTNMYIYPTGLAGSAGSLDTTFLNNKWWKVVSLSGANPQINLGYTNATAGTSGGVDKTFWQDEGTVSVGVVGASRGWGDSSSASVLVDALRTVTIQNFGEDLMFCNRGGPIYYWDTSTNATTGVPSNDGPAVVIDDNISGAADTIAICDSFLVADDHGHTIAIAANDIGSSTQNNMLVRWSDRHNPFFWTPTPDNEAGARILREGSRLHGGVITKNEIVIFTNTALYSMRYVGYPETYGFNLVTRNAGTYSRGSFVAVDSVVFFMGRDQFYVYDGTVKPLSKNLVNYVFDDINDSQKDKCFCGVNSKFTEVVWFYPSADSFEPNRWVSYNLSNDTWTYGLFDMTDLVDSGGDGTNNRTSWHDVTVFDNPMSTFVKTYDPDALPADYTSGVMVHEVGRTANGLDINHSIETGQVDISEGEMFMHYSRLLPDVELIDQNEAVSSPTITISVDGRNLPGRSETNRASVVVDFSANADGNLNYAPSENQTAIRGRARTVSFRAESNSSGYGWRLGTIRLDLKPDGRRA